MHDDETDKRLGGRIRELRRSRSLTLVQLAAMTGLSHPFLSQVERGQARPSMSSLGLIARALASSSVELLAAATFSVPTTASEDSVALVRRGSGFSGPFGEGTARLLAEGRRAFTPLEVIAENAQFDEPFVHDEDEYLYVLAGITEVDLGIRGMMTLRRGDSLYYAGGTSHRWRSVDGKPYRLLVVKQQHAEAGVPDHSGGVA
ncbi:MAG: helix-turn-helix domain-containing protein [Microbacteriaceae bacterium]